MKIFANKSRTSGYASFLHKHHVTQARHYGRD